MSFNDNVQLDTSQVESGGGGGGGVPGGMVVGGGVGGIILTIIIMVLQGLFGGGGGSVDPTSTGVQPAGQGNSEMQQQIDACKTGADANKSDVCRVVATANSVQAFWGEELPRYNRAYSKAPLVLYSGSTQSACGTASNQVGPFYCPNDGKIFIDTTFYDELASRFGGSTGPLAQEYVVAHEYGHHIQDIFGILGKAQQDPQGPQSGSVRMELMADCFAGMWAKNAQQTKDAQGTAFLKPFTEKDLNDAISAAQAVGDDNIQEKAQGRVTPESWTHGSSEARTRWFMTGMKAQDVNACDTFAVANVE